MTTRLNSIITCLNDIAPFDLAESWDNVGLLVGDQASIVEKILISLDPTIALIDEAIDIGADTIVTHHPVIFTPLNNINTSTPSGEILQKALSNQINIICCHTNLDSAMGGVNDVLADLIGLEETTPLQPKEDKKTGLGRIGKLTKRMDFPKLSNMLFNVLDLQYMQVAGKEPDNIEKIAICGGSGSDLAETARNMGADVFISAEIKHSVARWAEDCGFCIIDGGHYVTEAPIIKTLKTKLDQFAQKEHFSLDINLSTQQLNPFNILTK